MRILQPSKEFWITNISRKAQSLADLGICIYPMRSVNLLDKNHYRHLTEEQLIKSEASGSLFLKRNFVVHRKVAPMTPMKTPPLMQEGTVFPTRQRSAIDVEKITYDELVVDENEFAEETADIAQENHLGKWNK
jgi:hypothetical protein